MNKEEWIKKFIQEISTTTDKEQKVRKILKIIENLEYTESKEKVSIAYKRDIVEAILRYEQRAKLTESHDIFAQDNTEHITLLDMAFKNYGGK